ncbi:MAG TPA: tetratricopeptide repeat protein [Xanthobacteraceae bacterium]|nr:tetratricopeptide repeat protein [Xanthobacteraceae bacterium]
MIRHRLAVLTAASLFALSLPAGAALAAGGGEPPDNRDPGPVKQTPSGQQKAGAKKKKKQQERSDQEFRDGYRAAYALVQKGDYEAAYAAFKALDADYTPDVANYLGYTARKLGNYELSKFWYERALSVDPNHVRTWQYYGMWQVEQGNLLKAKDFLDKIEAICGNATCKEYQDLKGGIEGTVTY